MIKWLFRKAGLLHGDENGASFIIISLALPAIFGLSAFAIDLGYTYYVKSRLQNAADLAALAAGTLLVSGDKDAVKAKAEEYFYLNIPDNWKGSSAINVVPEFEVDCNIKLSDAGVTCYAKPGSTETINYVKVNASATTPLFFASALGFTTASLSADSVVAGGGTTMPPLNVAIILDTTWSMQNDTTTACGSSMPKLTCAKKAALEMVGTLWPAVDQVALYTYPGVTPPSFGVSPANNPNAKKNICDSGVPTVAAYSGNPQYRISDFSSDYRDKNTPPKDVKNPADPVIMALDSGTGCKGLQVGTTDGRPICSGRNCSPNLLYTFYADAIDSAQADLVAANDVLKGKGFAERQNVIVILSDGDANAPTSNIGGRRANQCLQAIDAARRATQNDTWVYSVAYNANTVGGPRVLVDSCNYDLTSSSTVKVTTVRYTTTYRKQYSTKNRTCPNNWTNVGTSQSAPTVTTVAAPGPTSGNGPVTKNPPNGTCSSTNKTVEYTEFYDRVTVSSPTTTTTYDRSACDTMRALASSPDKFFSVDPENSSGCISEANPNTNNLVSIFKKVASSLMKKRRVPKSAL